MTATTLNLAYLHDHQAQLTPAREAVVHGAMRLTYAQVNAMANQVAGGLRGLGLQPGDHVALSCPNLPYFPIAYYGILKMGGIVAPLNVLLKPREIAFHLKESNAKALGTVDSLTAAAGWCRSTRNSLAASWRSHRAPPRTPRTAT